MTPGAAGVPWPLVGASLRTALVVGSVLTLVNQSDAWRRDRWLAPAVLARVAANYLVPFLVALYSRWSAAAQGRTPPTS